MSFGKGLHTYLGKSRLDVSTDGSYRRGELECEGSIENDRMQGVVDRKRRLVNY